MRFHAWRPQQPSSHKLQCEPPRPVVFRPRILRFRGQNSLGPFRFDSQAAHGRRLARVVSSPRPMALRAPASRQSRSRVAAPQAPLLFLRTGSCLSSPSATPFRPSLPSVVLPTFHYRPSCLSPRRASRRPPTGERRIDIAPQRNTVSVLEHPPKAERRKKNERMRRSSVDAGLAGRKAKGEERRGGEEGAAIGCARKRREGL